MLQMPGKNLLLVCKMIMRHAGRMFVLSKICCMYLSWVWSCYKNNSQDGFGNSRNLILNFNLKVQLDSQLPFVQGGAEGCRSCSRSWRSQVASGRSLTVYLELRTGKQYPCGSCTTHDMKLAAMSAWVFWVFQWCKAIHFNRRPAGINFRDNRNCNPQTWSSLKEAVEICVILECSIYIYI